MRLQEGTVGYLGLWGLYGGHCGLSESTKDYLRSMGGI